VEQNSFTDWRQYPVRLVILTIVGAILGSLLDGFHTHSGTTVYTHPWLFLMAWWTPILFGGANVVMVVTHLELDKRWQRIGPRLSLPQLLMLTTWFFALYYLSGYLPTNNRGIALILGCSWALLWIRFDRSWQGIVLALMTGAVGCLVEITLIYLGTYHFSRPDRFGIPQWLPALYMLASLCVGSIGRAVIYGFSSPKSASRHYSM